MPMDHLYVFACGILWSKCGDMHAGWELIAVLQSYDPDLRDLSMEMLSCRRAPAQQLLREAIDYGVLLPEDGWRAFHALATSSASPSPAVPRVDNWRQLYELAIRPTGDR
jgi:hypothetical protein